MKHPCGTCCKSVNSNHRAVQCDICNKWHHIRCSLLDDKTYQYLMQTYDAWYCLNCIKTIYPFATEEIKLTLQGKNLSNSNIVFDQTSETN